MRILGVVLSVEHRATHIQLSVSDGTGTIDVRRMFTAEEQDVAEEQTEKFRQGVYIVVNGRLRVYENQMSVSAYAIATVDDANQITHHFLEAIYTHLLNTRGPIQQQGGGGAATATTTPMKPTSATAGAFRTPTQQFSGMAVQSPYGGMNAQNEDSEFNKNQQLILDALSASTNECGASIAEITSALRGQLTEQQTAQELNYLTNEGHVYSTIDDMHFKRTE